MKLASEQFILLMRNDRTPGNISKVKTVFTTTNPASCSEVPRSIIGLHKEESERWLRFIF